MAYYTNKNSDSQIAAVESVQSPQGRFNFFYAKDAGPNVGIKALLSVTGQQVVGKAQLDGKPVVITQGEKMGDELIKALAAQQEIFSLPAPKREFHPWKWRGYFSDVGHVLNLVSAKFSGGSLDAPKLLFAGLSLSANAVNKTYGAQKEDDPHRLQYLKKQVGDELTPLVPKGQALPDINATAAPLKKPGHRTAVQAFDDFMRRHSVQVGEIGLRYLGSVAMVLSITQLKKMGQLEKNGHLLEKFNWGRAWETMSKNSPGNAYGLLNTDKTNLWSGAIYLVGRTLGFCFAKAPDPYDPKPKTTLDIFREKYAFRLSSIIEVCAAATLAGGNFKMNKTTGKRDWVGGFGGSALVAALTTRIFAPYGVRQVNMDALYGYTADSLAVLPRDKMPQALADVSATLKQNLKDSPETFGRIFTAIHQKLAGKHEMTIAALLQVDTLATPHTSAGYFASRSAKPAADYQKRIARTPKATVPAVA